ncbi:MAG TPA: hypothetical protein VJB17_01560 [Patescibacteria group bacterium]|nr:hypothetical protein [Patescibacteria group bacterium]
MKNEKSNPSEINKSQEILKLHENNEALKSLIALLEATKRSGKDIISVITKVFEK